MKKILLIILSVVVLFAILFLISLGMNSFSDETKARDVFKEFDSNIEVSGYTYRIETPNGYIEEYYVISEDEYGYEILYNDYNEKLNCSSDSFYYVDGEYEEDLVEDECTYAMETVDDDYSELFKDFFEGNYDAEYTEEGEYYIITGEHLLGYSFKFKIHKNGKEVLYIDSDAVYSFKISDDVELPSK